MASVDTPSGSASILQTQILPVPSSNLGHFAPVKSLEKWEPSCDSAFLAPLQKAAQLLREGNTPVAFPTETVYGLGADATRSNAVLGIYKAKGRPSDNPLIIHVSDLLMLRSLLTTPLIPNPHAPSLIPKIYRPLIKRFWPGPLTILLPNPDESKLAPEVTAGLSTFGVRMPASPLALSLIALAGVPIAAPSANASTRPSCTTAQHVLHDLTGRIEMILDGGACDVGVESTVVDGLCDPPVVLRPGGVGIEDIRSVEGWEGVVRAYKDSSEVGKAAPRAPGMKYKHYSPRAKVVLFEAVTEEQLESWKAWELFDGKEIAYADAECSGTVPKIGIICTTHWNLSAPSSSTSKSLLAFPLLTTVPSPASASESETASSPTVTKLMLCNQNSQTQLADLFQISLGGSTKDIAHGLFSALRELDESGVDIIYIEGIRDQENGQGNIAAAVMNRLRKAASVIVN